MAVNSFVTFTYQDYEAETSSFTIRINDLDNATAPLGVDVAMDLLAVAADGVTLGTLKSRSILFDSEQSNSGVPATQANRELKWLIRAQEQSAVLPFTPIGKLYHYELPTADDSQPLVWTALTALRQAHSELWNPLHGAWAAFRVAFEANAKGDNRRSLIIQDVRLVGRNL